MRIWGKEMKKKILIGSIIAVVLLVLVSFSSVVGYNSVKSDLDISVEENKKEIVYQEKSSEEDCGCEDDSSDLEWKFPILCELLYPLYVLSGALYLVFDFEPFLVFMETLGSKLNCYWAYP